MANQCDDHSYVAEVKIEIDRINIVSKSRQVGVTQDFIKQLKDIFEANKDLVLLPREHQLLPHQRRFLEHLAEIEKDKDFRVRLFKR